jgi:hypothetical protein
MTIAPVGCARVPGTRPQEISTIVKLNANCANAERFVPSTANVGRLIPIGEDRRFRHALLAEYVELYDAERNHQGWRDVSFWPAGYCRGQSRASLSAARRNPQVLCASGDRQVGRGMK